MNMDFDLERRLAALTGNHSSTVLDWSGLHARLVAGYAARGVLECAKQRESVVDGGSFDPGAARALAGFGRRSGGGLDGINPTALGNGKWTHDNDAAVAGACSAGD